MLISVMPAANWAHFSPWAAQPCPGAGGIFTSSAKAQMTCLQASPTPRLRWVPSRCPREHLCSGIQLHRVPALTPSSSLGEHLAGFVGEAHSAANLGSRDALPRQPPGLSSAEGPPETQNSHS